MASNSKNIAELLNGDVTVTAVDIADDAVTAAKIADDAVTTDKLATQTGNVDFADNGKIRLGTGNDLEIYHNGTDSIIADVGTGDLYIRGSNDIRLQSGTGADTYAHFQESGYAKLYHNSAEKLATTSTGINVTGLVDANDVTVGDVADGTALIQMLANPTNGNNTIHFGDATSGGDSYDGYINYAHDTRAMSFAVGGGEGMRILRDDGTNDGLVKIRGGVGINFSSSLGASQVVLGIGTDNSYKSSVIFELATSQSLWAAGFIKIKCAAGRNGLESRSTAEYLYKFQAFNESISGIALVNSFGNTSSFTITVGEQNANSANGTVELKVKSAAATNHGNSVTYVECGHYAGINKVRRST